MKLNSPIVENNDAVNKGYVDGVLIGNKYEETIVGDGTTKEFEIEHNLGELYPMVLVLDENNEDTILTVVRDSANKLTLKFENAPALDEEHKVYVMLPKGPKGDKGGIEVVTEVPTSDNTDNLKIALLDSDPATKYSGWLYMIKAGE